MKSCENTQTGRPSTVPYPVTTASPERARLAHPELHLAVADEPVELDERAGIEEAFDPLPREQLAALTLALDRLLAPGVRDLVPQLLQPCELRLGCVVEGHPPEPNALPPSKAGAASFRRARPEQPCR